MGKYLMASIKSPKLLAIVLTVAALALGASTLAAINVSQNVSSSGTITTSPNIGVYSDSACTTNMTSINWGSIAAGGTATQTVYVKNTGTGSMTLSLATSSWSPSGASTYITISWNKQGTQLSAGQSVAATLTLTVSSSVTGITSFSNTITISGTG
jgi:archaellum component FlaG (FlaF/FlaG flagellin family)